MGAQGGRGSSAGRTGVKEGDEPERGRGRRGRLPRGPGYEAAAAARPGRCALPREESCPPAALESAMSSATKGAPWSCGRCGYENSSLFLNCAMCGHALKHAEGAPRHRQRRSERLPVPKDILEERAGKVLKIIDGQRRVAQRQAELLKVIVNRVVELEEEAAHEEKVLAGRNALLLLGTM